MQTEASIAVIRMRICQIWISGILFDLQPQTAMNAINSSHKIN